MSSKKRFSSSKPDSSRRRSRSRSSSSASSNEFIPLSLNPAAKPAPKEDPRIPPWIRQHTLKLEDPLLQLHEEIIDFYDYMQPSQSEIEAQQSVLRRLTETAKQIWEHAEVHVFGSLGNGLWMPNSDIDMVIMTNTEDEPAELINTYSHKLLQLKMVGQLERILTAKVPIVKIKDKSTGILVDISFNIDNGIEGINVVKDYISRYPEVKYLVFVMKYFLKQRGLNETYSGGIGSYLLFCMVVSAVQMHPAHREDRKYYSRYTLAHYLVHFFQLYGDVFNYEDVGISVKGEGYYFNKRSKQWFMSDKAGYLCVECPQNIDTDLGRNSFAIDLAKKAFAHAYKLLCAQNYTFAKTPLSLVIRVDDLLRNRPAHHI